jgi:hypothetical protein
VRVVTHPSIPPKLTLTTLTTRQARDGFPHLRQFLTSTEKKYFASQRLADWSCLQRRGDYGVFHQVWNYLDITVVSLHSARLYPLYLRERAAPQGAPVGTTLSLWPRAPSGPQVALELGL